MQDRKNHWGLDYLITIYSQVIPKFGTSLAKHSVGPNFWIFLILKVPYDIKKA